MKITYDYCTSEMKEDLISFINEHWQKDHILTKSKVLCDWQYKNEDGGYNFVLALDTEHNIMGILGFIPVAHFSRDLAVHKEYWLSIWKVREDCPSPGIGVGMLKFFNKTRVPQTICSLGLSQMVKPIYQVMNYQQGILKHFVAFNTRLKSFKFVSPPKAIVLKEVKSDEYLSHLDESDLMSFDEETTQQLYSCFPRKDSTYLINRYLNHPIYQYQILGISNRCSEIVSVIVVRIIEVNGTNIARVIDVFGSLPFVKNLSQLLVDWINENDVEYIDLMIHTQQLTHVTDSHFIEVTNDITIPNFFEPLEMVNHQIDYAFKTKYHEVFNIFKGDSDQDRPAQL